MITCPQCGKLNPENFNYCLDCGGELHPEETHSAESQFFLDLSSKSPDVKRAREDAGMDRTPAPVPRSPLAETPRPVARPTVPPKSEPVAEPKLAAPPHPTAPLELSPDDLNDDFDSDLDAPLLSNRRAEPVTQEPPVYADDADGIVADLPGEDLEAELAVSIEEDILDQPVADEVIQEDDLFPEALDLDDQEAVDWDQQREVHEPPIDATPIPAFSAEQDAAMRDTLRPQDSPFPEEIEVMDLTEEERVDLDQGFENDHRTAAKGPRCVSCGAELRPTDKFCGTCGSKVIPSADEASGQTMFMHIGAADSQLPVVVGRLVILEPSGREGRSFSLVEGENSCGRTCDAVLLDDRFVSPTHCLFTSEGDRVIVRDCDSANGVFIKVKGEVLVPSGAKLRLGQQLMLFQALEDFDLDPAGTGSDSTQFLGSPTGSIWGKLVHITHQGRVLGQYPLRAESVVMGREVGDILFPQDGFVSGTHARLSRKGNQCVILDLGSSNGTFVQVKEYALNNQDMVLIGKKLMRFEPR